MECNRKIVFFFFLICKIVICDERVEVLLRIYFLLEAEGMKTEANSFSTPPSLLSTGGGNQLSAVPLPLREPGNGDRELGR